MLVPDVAAIGDGLPQIGNTNGFAPSTCKGSPEQFKLLYDRAPLEQMFVCPGDQFRGIHGNALRFQATRQVSKGVPLLPRQLPFPFRTQAKGTGRLRLPRTTFPGDSFAGIFEFAPDFPRFQPTLCLAFNRLMAL